MKKKKTSWFWMVIILGVIALFAFVCISIPPHIYDLHQYVFQIIAVLLSLVFTATITNTLLSHQSASEEDKDKNVKIHENKVRTYSGFMKSLWSVLEDGKITSEEIKAIRSKLFAYVFFYLDSSNLAQIKASIDKFERDVKGAGQEDFYSSKGTVYYRDFASAVASCLKTDINGKEDNKEYFFQRKMRKCHEPQESDVKKMWDSLEFISEKYPSGGMKQEMGPENSSDSDSAGETVAFAPARRLKNQSWHFSELNEKQLQYLKDGGKELSLIEYGEYWRTNLVKQVRPGDVVFLFKGNWRYAGVFETLGWRVFEYFKEGDVRYVTEITSDGIEKAVVRTEDKVPVDKVEALLAQYDIYGSYLDQDSTSCANIVVDVLSFIPDGVVTPNTTYRKTISRYDPVYAVRLLEKFNEKEDSLDKKKKMAALYEPFPAE